MNKATIKSPNLFPIVAIGASAGGLEAITELLKNLPPDTGMSFIYVQHLSPDHKSMLSEILSKATKMKVQEIDDMDKIKPDNVFVIPPNKAIEVNDGRIKLIPRAKDGAAITVDILFTTLAHAQKERVIGVILSGSASDGTVGMKAIKHEGGITFAQDESAKFPSMPESAVAAGAVDFILSPKKIALELVHLSEHPFVKSANGGVNVGKEDLIENNNPDLKDILAILHKASDVDFSQYKMTTVKRRIIRRMLLYKIKSLKGYAGLLKEKKEEAGLLYNDLLINVTSFFRDAPTYRYLKTTLLPKLLKRKKPGEALRIWVAACSTGEEAYSIAMLLLEIKDSKYANIPVQIFGTDLDKKAIAKARAGTYLKSELEGVSPRRLQRFFTKDDGGYHIVKAVRDMCVFAPHNILSDPPFAHVDFISCCNLLIYMDTAAQKKIIATFHYALNGDGYLMLGTQESISQSSQLFTSFNKKFKIFSRKKNSGIRTLPVLTPRFAQPSVAEKNIPITALSKTPKNIPAKVAGLGHAIDRVLLSRYMPASVVINKQMEILEFRGATDLFFSPQGKASFNILKMTRPEMAFALRTAILQAIKTNQAVHKRGIEVKINSSFRIINIEVAPLKIEGEEPLLLILFTEVQAESVHHGKGKRNSSNAGESIIKKLEQELTAARDEMLTYAQEQEAFNEELQSANEEVTSSNEELQTVNEELETSKEEIQSANEELTTINEQLQTSNEALTESYAYSNSVIRFSPTPMIVLNKDLRIKTANKSFYKKFKVDEKETESKHLYDLGNKQWDIPALHTLLDEIMSDNTHFENFEVKHTFPDIGEKTILLNASRFVQEKNHEPLIVLAFTDVTEVRAATERTLKEKKVLEKAVQERTKELQQSTQLHEEKNEELVTINEELKQANEEIGLNKTSLEKNNIALELKNIELEKMNEELESFAYVSGHDLQEPLRQIQTFSKLIVKNEGEKFSDKSKDYFHRVMDGARRMQNLINDLLDYSRLNADERKFESADLNILIEGALKQFEHAIEEKHAVVHVTGLCQANVISFQFVQLMHNLIGNALKFSKPETPPHIIIESRSIKYSHLNDEGLTPGKEYCHISVSDNGIGFDPEFKDRIFQVFQKLHGKEEYPGTGIGLAIVKKIVENHNGIVTATGELGKGSRFDVYIPV